MDGMVGMSAAASSAMASGMDMGSAASSTDTAYVPLSTAGLDMTNETVAFNYLQMVLDDSELQIIANSYATYFWYGIVTAIGLAAIYNLILQIKSFSRPVLLCLY